MQNVLERKRTMLSNVWHEIATCSHELAVCGLGPRVKVIMSNILPAKTRCELKFFPKIAFIFLAIILKWQVPNGNISRVFRKMVTVLAGPWSASVVLAPQVM